MTVTTSDATDTTQIAGVHPVADIFPMMSDRELANLVKDIEQHGLREPIWLHRDGRIIDGRNRYLACEQVGVKPEIRVYRGDDTDLVEFVVSLNLHRRHLNESQRAMVAARIANLRQGERTDLEPSANLQKVSQSEAAKLLNVSTRTVASAEKVNKLGVNELVSAVESGEVAVSAAAAIAEATPEEQRELIAARTVSSPRRRTSETQEGKQEQRTEQRRNRRPLTEAFRDSALQAVKDIERLERLVLDDRYPRNAEQVARMSRGDLLRAADLLNAVIDRIPTTQ